MEEIVKMFAPCYLLPKSISASSKHKIGMTICGLSFEPKRHFGEIDFEASEVYPGII